jgi:hypothetical protein
MEQLLKTISSQAFVTACFQFDLKLTLGLIPESLAHDPVGHWGSKNWLGLTRIVLEHQHRPVPACSWTLAHRWMDCYRPIEEHFVLSHSKTLNHTIHCGRS